MIRRVGSDELATDVEELKIALGLAAESELLTSADVRKLEKSLQAAPNDKLNRLRLMGYYQRGVKRPAWRSTAFLKHVLWMIEHHPDSLALEHVIYVESTPEFKIAKRRWNQAIKDDPANPKILWNAGKFSMIVDSGASRKYFQQGFNLDPKNEEWSHALWHHYARSAFDTTSRADRANVRVAIKHARRALDLHKKYPGDTYLEVYFEHEVRSIADLALSFSYLDDAEYFGECFLASKKSDKIKTDKCGWKTVGDPVSRRVHWAYSIMGRVAIRKNDVALATNYLKLMEVHDPRGRDRDLQLAQDLLEVNEIQPVIDYMENCVVQIRNDVQAFIASENPRLKKLFVGMRDARFPDKTLEESIVARGDERISPILSWIAKIKSPKRSKLRMYTYIPGL